MERGQLPGPSLGEDIILILLIQSFASSMSKTHSPNTLTQDLNFDSWSSAFPPWLLPALEDQISYLETSPEDRNLTVGSTTDVHENDVAIVSQSSQMHSHINPLLDGWNNDFSLWPIHPLRGQIFDLDLTFNNPDEPIRSPRNVHEIDATSAPESSSRPYHHLSSMIMINQSRHIHPTKSGRTRYGQPTDPETGRVSFRLLGAPVDGIIIQTALHDLRGMILIDAEDTVLQGQAVNVVLHILVRLHPI